ncbi:MAG: zinc ribbon domain-containing protein [Planctomycetota bacterium]|nr:zinc ribbon domain-containing protein [Planctomycetota bacterium]
MPTYDYRCDACGHTMDAFQGIKDDALADCPECNEPKLRRLIGSGAGIIFKGSGFYETDYKRSRTSSNDGGSSDKSGEDKSGSSDSSKSSDKKSSSSGSGSGSSD